MPESGYYNTDQAAEVLGVHRSRVLQLRREGKLPTLVVRRAARADCISRPRIWSITRSIRMTPSLWHPCTP